MRVEGSSYINTYDSSVLGAVAIKPFFTLQGKIQCYKQFGSPFTKDLGSMWDCIAVYLK